MTDDRSNLDFLAVGDIVTDAFIRVKNASVECDVDHNTCKLCFNFGDKIPYEFVEVLHGVGNSPNAAVSASRLGLKSALATDIGSDDEGQRCLESLQENGVITDHINTHQDQVTNYHYVLWYESERTILVKHQEYSYQIPELKEAPRWVYFSSLAENSLPYHDAWAEYLKAHPEVNLAFQPGTFQMRMGYERLKDLYQLSKIFFCNTQEAKRILGLENQQVEIIELLQKVHELGPEIVIVTDGPKGAYAYQAGSAWFMPPYPDPKTPLERTGAGDSFSSTLTSYLALGKTLPEALERAPINSMSVVQEIGAQRGLLTADKIEEHLANRPDDYQLQQIA